MAELAVGVAPLGYWITIPAPPSVIALVAEPSVYTCVYVSGGEFSAMLASARLRLIEASFPGQVEGWWF